MQNVYDIARTIKLPGVKATVTFHPEHLTPRVRNAVRRMIDSGIVKGYGQSAQVAKRLLKYGGISYLATSRYGVGRHGYFEFSDDVKAQLRELHEVYLLSDVLGKVEDSYIRSSRSYMESFVQKIREFMPIYSEEIAAQFAAVAMQGRRQIDKDKTAVLLAEFDCNAPILLGTI